MGSQWRGSAQLQKGGKENFKNICWTFCSSINDLPKSTSIHRALSREPKIKLGSLVAPWSRRTQSERESLEVFLTTPFPNLGVTQNSAAPAASLLARRPDLSLATRMVTYKRVEWAVESFARDRWHIAGLVANGTGGCHPTPG